MAKTAKQIEKDLDNNPEFQAELKRAHGFVAAWDKERKLDYSSPGLALKVAEWSIGAPSLELLKHYESKYQLHMGNNIDVKRINEQYLRMQNALLHKIVIVTANMSKLATEEYIKSLIVPVIEE